MADGLLAYDWASPLVCISRVPVTALSPPSANIPRPVSPLPTNCRAENNAAAQSDLNEANWMQQWLWHAADCVTMDILQWRLANTSDLALFFKDLFTADTMMNFINQPLGFTIVYCQFWGILWIWCISILFLVGHYSLDSAPPMSSHLIISLQTRQWVFSAIPILILTLAPCPPVPVVAMSCVYWLVLSGAAPLWSLTITSDRCPR